MKIISKKGKILKLGSVILAAVLAVSSIVCFWKQDTMVVEAAEDSLPGIVQLRKEIMQTSGTYTILEIVPDLQAAEIGFYVGLAEPFPSLYDTESKQYIPWGNMIAKLHKEGKTETEIEAYMVTVQSEAQNVIDHLTGDGDAPFSYSPFDIVDATTPGAKSIVVQESTVRGYGEYKGEGVAEANWLLAFQKLENADIPLSTVNSGIGQAYYKVTAQTNYTYRQLQTIAEGSTAAKDMPVYEIINGAFRRTETVASAWQRASNNATVSGNDLITNGSGVSGGDVSDGDAGYVASMDDLSGYYNVVFQLITPSAPVDAGTTVYLVDNNNSVYVGQNGNYSLTAIADGSDAACDAFTKPATTLYYTGGLTNNEVFKRKVLGLSADECNSFKVDVVTTTPEKLNATAAAGELATMLQNVDMIYINSGATRTAMVSGSDPVPVGYSATNDITYEVVEKLGLHIYLEQTACLFDLKDLLTLSGSGYAAGTNGDTNLAKLAGFLLYENRNKYLNANETGLTDSIKNLKLSNFVNSYGSEIKKVDTNHDLGFVRDNVWFFTNERDSSNQPIHKSGLFLRKGQLDNLQYSTINGENTEVIADYKAVLSEIHYENLYRSADDSYSGVALDETITDKTIWRYVVNYSRRRAVANKEKLTVLDIEPAFTTPSANLSKEKVSIWTNVDEDNISIVTVPMNQFVGMIDDLNATYDMIYIGSSTEGLNVSGGVTVYNDTSMNGLLYSHVGDSIEVDPALSGLLDTDFTGNNRSSATVKKSTVQRFSGNDLTVEKYNALMDYLGAYYPVVIDSNLISNKKIREDRVDNSSYLYEFLNEVYVTTPKKNVFSSSELPVNTNAAKNALFEFYANKPKLTLQASQDVYPDLIMTTAKYSSGSTVNNNVTQINKSGDSFYLEYAFRIKDSGAVYFDQSYTCKLYLDANADGKFSETNEELSGITITAGGETVSSTNLKAGVDYVARREVPSTYSGCITWQLQVTQSNNDDVRAVKKGYTKLNNPAITEEDRTIKILQVYFANDNRVVNLQESIGTLQNGSYNQIDGADGDGQVRKTDYFKANAESVKNDFLLDITTIRETQFSEGKIGETVINMDDYDMLILGFSDAAKDKDWSATSITKIKDFIESGKSVMFAHDMTSFTNIENYKSTYIEGSDSDSGYMGSLWGWGYRINTYVRDLVGLDTYGITGRNLNNGSPYAILGAGNALTRNGDKKLVDGDGNAIPEPIKKDGRYLYNTTDTNNNLLPLKDVAYKPGSARQSTVAEVQGYTAYIMARTSIDDDQRGYRSGLKSKGSHSYSSTAVKINDGQITNFPFVIGDSISIRETHNQYYTLDLNGDSDNDGQADAVVWFGLSGGKFAKAPGDVKNNYYIYNKGNVTYTGMGDITNDKPYGSAVTDVEAKLFLNTMIAAYQAGKRTPDVVTMDSSGLSTDIIYNYYDPSLTNVDITESSTIKVYFRISDLNMTQGNKTVEIRYYVEDNKEGSDNLTDGDGRVINSGLKLREVTAELKDATYTEAGAKAATAEDGITKLNTDSIYYVEVPVSYFNIDKNGYDSEFYIYAQTTMTKATQGDTATSVTPWGYQSVRYVNCELFELD